MYIADINNYKYGYPQFELLISTIRIVHIRRPQFELWNPQCGLNVNTAFHRLLGPPHRRPSSLNSSLRLEFDGHCSVRLRSAWPSINFHPSTTNYASIALNYIKPWSLLSHYCSLI